MVFELSWPFIRAHLHINEGSMVGGDARKVVFHHGHSARKCHMPTAAEQSHTRKAQDGGHQRGIGDTAQALDATLEAACRGRKRHFVFCRNSLQQILPSMYFLMCLLITHICKVFFLNTEHIESGLNYSY